MKDMKYIVLHKDVQIADYKFSEVVIFLVEKGSG